MSANNIYPGAWTLKLTALHDQAQTPEAWALAFIRKMSLKDHAVLDTDMQTQYQA